MTTRAQAQETTVFVIMPFGSGSQAKIHLGRYESLILPAIRAARERLRLPVEAVRSDLTPSGGRVTDQILRELLRARLVIADLYGLNPNVLYELGVRHAASQGTILIAPEGTELPFDLYDLKVIWYSPHPGLEREPCASIADAVVEAIENAPSDSPVSAPEVRRIRETISSVRDHLADLGELIGGQLARNAGWAGEALEQARLGTYAGTLFGERQNHFRAEKRVLADAFVPLLLQRCKALLGQYEKVILIVDSGTTLVPFLDALARRGKEELDEASGDDAAWIDRLIVYTNNVPGILKMMEHRRGDPKGRYASLVFETHLLPGSPLPAYSAVAGDETVSAVEKLCAAATTAHHAVIGILTGNWIRIRNGEPRCPIPLARGVEHLRFKQAVLDGILGADDGAERAGEVFVLSPLGKVFCNQTREQVDETLKGVEDPRESGDRLHAKPDDGYEELRIDGASGAKVKLVVTSRRADDLLYGYSNTVIGALTPGAPGSFPKSPIGHAPHMALAFGGLPHKRAEQFEEEFPHPRTRTLKFTQLFSVTDDPREL